MIQEGEPCPNCGGTLVRISLREGMCDSCGSIVPVRYHTAFEQPAPQVPETSTGTLESSSSNDADSLLMTSPAESITIDEFHRRSQNGEFPITQAILQQIAKTGRAMVTTTDGDTKVFSIINRPTTSKDTVVQGPKSMAAAVILGIVIVGAGLMYVGKVGKGLLFLILAVLLCWTIVVPVVLWIVGIVQACQLVKENNKLWDEYCSKDCA